MKTPQPRLAGIDVARGLATLLMIQTHAYDGWVQPEARASLAFGLTRTLGTLPLPMFLLLAGFSLGLRVQHARNLQQPARSLRRALTRTALGVLGWAYALNVLYALLDGSRGLTSLLRIDVLHAIGLSLGVLAWVAVGGVAVSGVAGGSAVGGGTVGGGASAPSARRFLLGTCACGLAALALCPSLTRLGHGLRGPARYVFSPLVEVPGLSPMPLVPLLWFGAVGALLGFGIQVSALTPSTPLEKRRWRQVCGLAASAVLLGTLGAMLLAELGSPITRSSPSLWLNAFDLTGRGVLAIAFCLLLTPQLGASSGLWLALGRHSLLVYAVHLPFCYGRFAIPIKRALSMTEASVILLYLVLACLALCLLRDQLQKRASKHPSLALSWWL